MIFDRYCRNKTAGRHLLPRLGATCLPLPAYSDVPTRFHPRKPESFELSRARRLEVGVLGQRITHRCFRYSVRRGGIRREQTWSKPVGRTVVTLFVVRRLLAVTVSAIMITFCATHDFRSVQCGGLTCKDVVNLSFQRMREIRTVGRASNTCCTKSQNELNIRNQNALAAM